MIKNNTDLVSVIIPTYNRSRTILRAIKSVLNQTYKNIEVIIVDDASTDNTEEIVKGLNDPRIIYIKHETNKGGAAARNTGIKLAKSEYIAFQDSDDEWYPEKLQLQTDALLKAESDVGVVYSSFIRISKHKKEVIPGGHARNFEGDIFKKILSNNFVTTQTALVAKRCFDKVGIFDESLPRLQDWELWLRISKHYKFIYISKPLVTAYIQKDSISNSVQGLQKALFIIEEKHKQEFIKNDPFALANKYCWLGRLLIKEKKYKEGLEYLTKSIKISPLTCKFRVFYYICKLRILLRQL